MALRIPTADDIMELAEANYFELSEEELADFQDIIRGMFGAYELLEGTPSPSEPLKYPNRDPGYRPSRQDDPFNAIVRRCTLKGAPSGKLAGKRIGLKNNICVAGMPLHCGSLVLDGYVADIDATIVTRLLDAGAEIVATLNLDDFAFSSTGATGAQGPVYNPHNPEFLAGGSSAGSAAALYYDDIDITIGGDQGGSIRIPASWCGVVGHKPTHGLVPYTGIMGIDHTFDHAGPMARTVEEAALTLDAIAGKDPLDPRQGEVPVQSYTESLGAGVDGMRIGVLAEGFGWRQSEPDVDASVRKALEVYRGLGAQLVDVSVPDHLECRGIIMGLMSEGYAATIRSNGMGYHWQGRYNISLAETLGKSRQAQANDFPPAVKLQLILGTYLSERYHGRVYAKAQNLRGVLRASYEKALEQADVLAMPTTAIKSIRYDPEMGFKDMMASASGNGVNTASFDMTGHPAISIPCGKSDGLPVGLMLVGKHFDDATLLRAAHAFEQQVNWETL